LRILPIVAVLSAAVFLSACDEEVACTQADADAKVAELTTKITELASTDPAKLAELAPKVQEIATKAAAGGDDLAGACKALDEMMAELAG
jgi:outer membrane murein-binding lipoprotein Lpp